MTLPLLVLIGVAGACGGVARYLCQSWGQAVSARAGLHATTPIFVINLSGCIGAGLIAGAVQCAAAGSDTVAVVGLVGFLGGFTTFSTAIADAWTAAGPERDGANRRARCGAVLRGRAGRLVWQLGACWAGAYLGFWVASWGGCGLGQ